MRRGEGSTGTVQCSYIGLLADGTTNANTGRGLNVLGASARIGGLDTGQGNVISSNSGYGVQTGRGSTDTAIRGNFIGTDVTGLTARANGVAINNQDGPATWRDITRNLIAGNNGGAAIALEADDQITASTDQIRIQRNQIGFNRTMTALLLNGGDGIGFAAGSITNLLIGGAASTEGNQITSNNDAIDMRSVSNIRIRGNTLARAPGRGIWLENVSNVTIGGTAGSEGNIIGGNGSDGINLRSNSSNVSILGNLIQPVTITGGTFANNDHGIWIENVSNVNIGDGTAAGRNVIGGNRRRGIWGSGTNSGVTINGNYIGTDATGNVAVASGQNEGTATKDAISFDAGGSFTGLAILNNVIGGYESALLEAWNSTGNGLTIQGNSIGVGANGTSQIVSGNAEDLIYIGSGSYSNVLIGGSAAGQGNVLAFSNRSGIRLESTGSNIQVIGNTIRNNTRNGVYLVGSTRAALVSNRIYANSMIGIDLGENGVTANDAGDGDSGANDLLNFPQISSVNVKGSNQLQYGFTLDAPAATSGYRVEFFASSAADPSGFGEGERYLGHVDIAHGGGTQSYSGTLTTLTGVAIGDIIAATATRRTAAGAWDTTSEFSAVATALGTARLTVGITSQVFEPAPSNPFATPGNDMLLTATVTNVGTGSTDANSIFTVLTINAANAFRNDATPAFGGIVGFTSGSAALTFNPATDLRFSNSATPPTSLAQCTYAPVTGYDPQVRHVCINPKGTLPNGAPAGQFTVQLRARIN
jgi:parallel beta-helix repeat protein